MEVPERLRSRKFWVTAVTALLLVLNDAIGLDLDQETINGVALAVSAYLVGQSAVDYGQAKERAQKYEAWVNNATKAQPVQRDEA